MQISDSSSKNPPLPATELNKSNSSKENNNQPQKNFSKSTKKTFFKRVLAILLFITHKELVLGNDNYHPFNDIDLYFASKLCIGKSSFVQYIHNCESGKVNHIYLGDEVVWGEEINKQINPSLLGEVAGFCQKFCNQKSYMPKMNDEDQKQANKYLHKIIKNIPQNKRNNMPQDF